MAYIHNLKLDVNARPHQITIFVKRGDTSRKLRAEVVADGMPYDLNGYTAILHVDDNSNIVEVTSSTNIVEIVVPGTETPGMKCGDIAIVKDGVILSTANFKVNVVKSPI